ncbi:MAG TPA: thermonuclease family protein [Steroidobacteraceae bacterium]|nr:thermonuclease family protein [Steroidobacteraceae bacterium]
MLLPNLRPRAGGLVFLLIATACSAQAASSPQELVGTPSRVFDGDSFMLRVERQEIEVRLVDIDAPEHGQPYADTARSALDGLIWKERLRAVVVDDDKYGRKVCRVYRLRDGLDVNRKLVVDGHVWVYRRRARDMSLYDLERGARRDRRGLWALRETELEPPWRWRREHPREARTSTGPSPP